MPDPSGKQRSQSETYADPGIADGTGSVRSTTHSDSALAAPDSSSSSSSSSSGNPSIFSSLPTYEPRPPSPPLIATHKGGTVKSVDNSTDLDALLAQANAASNECLKTSSAATLQSSHSSMSSTGLSSPGRSDRHKQSPSNASGGNYGFPTQFPPSSKQGRQQMPPQSPSTSTTSEQSQEALYYQQQMQHLSNLERIHRIQDAEDTLADLCEMTLPERFHNDFKCKLAVLGVEIWPPNSRNQRVDSRSFERSLVFG